MDPEVPEDRTEERGGQEHDHHHQSVAQVYTEGRVNAMQIFILLFTYTFRVV